MATRWELKQRDIPKMDVIVPVYNERATLRDVLDRILSQSDVARVVVVDDGSTDGSVEMIRKWSGENSRVKILRHVANHGKGTAIQSGLQLATGHLVLIQDGDMEYNP